MFLDCEWLLGKKLNYKNPERTRGLPFTAEVGIAGMPIVEPDLVYIEISGIY